MQNSNFYFLLALLPLTWTNLYSQKQTASTCDNALIGEWLISQQLNCDGTAKMISTIVKGMKYIFYTNGRVIMTSPSIERQFNSMNTKGPKPNLRWQTDNNVLTITGAETGRGTLEQKAAYKISGDTLMLSTPDCTKSYFIKKQTTKKR
ncbi:hypothetical protein QQ054_33345 [Oscillatoria amoena NRMC-F 0135]|nr:hypothetical protein [Oscillatoria amoena NRMC-F 0135]